MLPENDVISMPSQEKLGRYILSPPNYISPPETDPNVELQEKELTGSITKTENRVNALLDKLLSYSCENLDKDGVVSFLQEHSQIKPFGIDKLCFPNFLDVGKIDFLSKGERLPKPWSTPSDIHNLMKGISNKTPVKHIQVAETPAHSLSSPTPPKSPRASINILKKCKFQSSLSSDPFSAIDLSPAKNSSPAEHFEHIDELLNQLYTRKELRAPGKLKSLITKISDIRVDGMCSQEVITGDSVPLLKKPVIDELSRFGVGIDAGSRESSSDIRDINGSGTMDERVVDDNDCVPNTDTDLQADRSKEMEENETVSSGQFNVNFEDSSRPCTDFQTDGPCETEENVRSIIFEDCETFNYACYNVMFCNKLQVEDMPQNAEQGINIENQTVGKLESNQSQPDQLSPATGGAHGPSKIPDVIPEQHSENIQEHSRVSTNEQSKAKRPAYNGRKRKAVSQEPSRVSTNEQSKAKRPSRNGRKRVALSQESSRVSMNERRKTKRSPCSGHKRKALSQRLKIAGPGTSEESRVRRSTRIKMRPLEYWKGERFLYGRVQESLTTVIGVKYVSPAKGDGKPSIRVESYISDEYKELVELAALH